jgi:large subunit ribosomal protein L10
MLALTAPCALCTGGILIYLNKEVSLFMPSQKILDAKKAVVSALVADFKDAKSFVFADARGLTVLQDTTMRAELRKNNVKYQVIKNTTSAIIFKELGVEGLEETFKGPTAIAYSKEDAIVSAKFMKQFADKFDKLSLKGGVIDGKALSAADVNALATIPSKEVLYGQLVYTLISPITKLAVALNAIAEKDGSEAQPELAVVGASTETAAE